MHISKLEYTDGTTILIVTINDFSILENRVSEHENRNDLSWISQNNNNDNKEKN